MCAVTKTAPAPSVRSGAGKAGSQPGAQPRSPSAVKRARVGARDRLTSSSALQQIVSGGMRTILPIGRRNWNLDLTADFAGLGWVAPILIQDAHGYRVGGCARATAAHPSSLLGPAGRPPSATPATPRALLQQMHQSLPGSMHSAAPAVISAAAGALLLSLHASERRRV